jgi:glycosyltransferase involved in cell wall biosynthesis
MSQTSHPPPCLSVVIRTYNSWSTAREIIARLNDRRVEVILVDSGSSDLPPDVDRLVEKVIRCHQQPFSYGGSLNAGVATARGEWAWVLSSHCIPVQGEVIEQIVKLLASIPPEVACVIGSTIPPGGRQASPYLGEPSYSLVESFDFPGGNPNCLYRTDRLRERPFDARLLTCEDIEWFIAARASGASVAVSRSFPVLYRTRRPVGVMFRKGLNEYRVGKCLGKPRPRVGWSVLRRIVRNFAKVILLRLTFGDFLRKESYILGWFCAENFLRPFTEADIRRPPSGASAPASPTDLPDAISVIRA